MQRNVLLTPVATRLDLSSVLSDRCHTKDSWHDSTYIEFIWNFLKRQRKRKESKLVFA